MRSRIPWLVVLALLLLHVGGRLVGSQVRYFDPDEFQHLHAAYRMHQGDVIYRDFFEHHAPLYYHAIAPLFALTSDPWDLAHLVRLTSWLSLALGLLLLYRWGARLGGRAVGVLTVLMIAVEAFNTKSTIEIRPDAMQYPAVLLGAGWFVHSLQTGRQRYAAGAGVMLAVALLCTPRTLFAGVGVFSLWVWAMATAQHQRRLAVTSGLVLGLAMLAALGVAFAAFAAEGSLAGFLRYNFAFNLGYGTKIWPWEYLRRTLWSNPGLWMLGAAGLFSWCRHERRQRLDPWRAAVIILFLNGLIGAFFVPNPVAQYWLNTTPWLALLAGWQLHSLLQEASLARVRGWLLGLAAVVVVAEQLRPTWDRPIGALPLVLGAAALTLAATRWLPRAVPALLVATLLWWPTQGLTLRLASAAAGESESGAQQRELMEMVHRLAGDGTVMDGFTGLGYRTPRASFYPFVHHELIDTVGQITLRDEITRDLLSTPPAVVLVDGPLWSLFGDRLWRQFGAYRVVTARSWAGWNTPWVTVLVPEPPRSYPTPIEEDPTWRRQRVGGWTLRIPTLPSGSTARVALDLPPDVATMTITPTFTYRTTHREHAATVIGTLGQLESDGTPVALFNIPHPGQQDLEFDVHVETAVGRHTVAWNQRLSFAPTAGPP